MFCSVYAYDSTKQMDYVWTLCYVLMARPFSALVIVRGFTQKGQTSAKRPSRKESIALFKTVACFPLGLLPPSH